MATTAFNAHNVIKRYEKADVPKKQIDAHVEVLVEVTDELVTKGHLDLKLESFEHKITDKLTLRFGLMLSGTIAVLTFLEQVVFK